MAFNAFLNDYYRLLPITLWQTLMNGTKLESNKYWKSLIWKIWQNVNCFTFEKIVHLSFSKCITLYLKWCTWLLSRYMIRQLFLEYQSLRCERSWGDKWISFVFIRKKRELHDYAPFFLTRKLLLKNHYRSHF